MTATIARAAAVRSGMVVKKRIAARRAEILNADRGRAEKLAAIIDEFLTEAEIRALTPRQGEAVALWRSLATYAEASEAMGVLPTTYAYHLSLGRNRIARLDDREARQ